MLGEAGCARARLGQIIIDADTGLLLSQGSAALNTVHEWAELDTDAQLPDKLFVYSDDDRPARRYG